MEIVVLKRNDAPVGAPVVEAPSRYHIFRQARAGNFMLEFQTNSAAEVVEMFGVMSPAFDGGAIRIWDHHEQRVCASVEWHPENTPCGFAVRTRQNVFQNTMLAALARQISERETMRSRYSSRSV